ncbi:hypothetical protein ACSBR1_005236 [Camellia fascicularis]
MRQGVVGPSYLASWYRSRSSEMCGARQGVVCSTAHELARQEGRRQASVSCPELGYAGMQPSSVLIEHGKRSALASCTARPLIAEKL